MAIIHRLSRLFRADVHAVLDLIEEPQVLLRQAIRDMEEALDRRQRQLAAHEREARQLAGREIELGRVLEKIESELDLCFEAGKDELARGLVRRKLEHEKAQAALRRRQEAVDNELTAARSALEDDRRRLDAMREKAELLSEEVRPAPGEEICWPDGECGLKDDDVEVAFLREKQRRAQS